MKIRTVFVSNSSSISFIIGFEEKPKDAHEIRNILFDKHKEYDEFTCDEISKRVFDDIKDQKPLDYVKNKSEIIKEISSGWFESKLESNYEESESYKYLQEFRKNTGKDLFSDEFEDSPKRNEYYRLSEIERKEHDKRIEKSVFKFWKEHKKYFNGKKIFIVNYSDKSGDIGCAIEHGDVFRELPRIRVCHH